MTEKIYHAGLRIIHENRIGYIGVCPCCDEVQFCLGNVVSFMPKDAFMKLYHSFQKLNDQMEDRFLMMPNGKKITVLTPVENIILSFSKDEFLQAMELFDKMRMNLSLMDSLTSIECLN